MRQIMMGLAATALLMIGCSEPKTPEQPPLSTDTSDNGDANPTSGAEVDATKIKEKNPNKANIIIGKKIIELCGDIPAANFAFDSASLGGDAKGALDALAKCFISGPAKDQNMNIVGHADPRGEEVYNNGLGQKRSGAVAGYLESAGLAEDRMESTSRGELDATGTDEESWAKDRKVEIFLAE